MHPRDALSQLTALGHTETAIAALVSAEIGRPVAQGTINRIKRGVIDDPAYTVGAAVLRVHHRLISSPQRANGR